MKKKEDLFFIIDSISATKQHLMNEGLKESLYKPYMVNKAFSYHADSIMHANEMNKRYHIPQKYQYEYLFQTIRKRKRFAKWHKKQEDETLKLIMEHYGVSMRKAEEYATILPKEEIQKIAKQLNKGGLD